MTRPLLIVVALAAALALAACGGDSEVAADATSTSTAAPADSTSTTTAAPADDGARVQDGDLVRVHYTGSLEDGEVFDSSRDRQPLEFVVASGQVITGFDDAVRGLAVGETRTQRVEPADGYGESDPERVLEFNLADLPSGVQPGDALTSQTGATATVVSVDETAGTAMIDTNHFLAGKVLIFEVELVEIVPGS